MSAYSLSFNHCVEKFPFAGVAGGLPSLHGVVGLNVDAAITTIPTHPAFGVPATPAKGNMDNEKNGVLRVFDILDNYEKVYYGG